MENVPLPLVVRPPRGGRERRWRSAGESRTRLRAEHANEGLVAVGVDRVLAAEAARSNRLIARSAAEAQADGRVERRRGQKTTLLINQVQKS